MTTNPHDDACERELLGRLRAGDEAAFEQVVRRCGGALLATARRLLRDEEEARDAVQEAFLLAWRGLDRFEGTSRISTWLHRIVVNAALMRLRSRRRRPEQSIEELLPRFDDAGAHLGEAFAPPAAEREIDEAARRRRVRNAIARLPETYRQVLMLRDIEELDTEETAAQLGMTPGAVKTRLHRARQALMTLLRDEPNEVPAASRGRARGAARERRASAGAADAEQARDARRRRGAATRSGLCDAAGVILSLVAVASELQIG